MNDIRSHFEGPSRAARGALADEDYAAKIAALLRQAENSSVTEAEAQVFLSKAQSLMTRYAISEALIEAAKTGQESEKIVSDQIAYGGVYSAALFDIGAAIARANNCRPLVHKTSKSTVLTLNGFASDVARVKMLDTSVQIQASGGLVKYWAGVDSSWMSPMQKFKARREYLFGFARGLTMQLTKARREGERAAQATEVERGSSSDSVALVLQSRKVRVDEWMDTTYGKLRTSTRNYSYGGADAGAAGTTAGRSADVSSSGKISGGTRELGR